MNIFKNYFNGSLVFLALGWISHLSGDAQTATLSPVVAADGHLPFHIQLELETFTLPNGIHSGVEGVYDGKWLLLAGRTNGMHSFDPTNNFPAQKQNDTVYVVDPIGGKVFSRSLKDKSSGLTQQQIDLLSVTAPQGYQSNATLYMTGGYGINSSTGLFSTKDTLTAINIPGLMHWVVHPFKGETAAQYIRQISNPIFKVTGGYMAQIGKGPTLLVFGQDFEGEYTDDSDGKYTKEIRRFNIIDDGENLAVEVKESLPKAKDPNYRRRDLTVVPIVQRKEGRLVGELVAFSGVFTPSVGVWTVPVEINANGVPFMANPSLEKTFKQGMNNYICAAISLYSEKSDDMFTVLCGGITYGFFQDGMFQTSDQIPFTNQITTIRLNKNGNYKQFLMKEGFPEILSTKTNFGNQLLFGSGAVFLPASEMPLYKNEVISFDALGKDPVLIGYIFGGIQSTVPNTSTKADSGASPYIFRVILVPHKD